jgi:hypothetical protein
MPDLMQDFPANPGTTTGGDAFTVAIYVIISMFVIVGIVYLFSRFLSNRNLEDWAKNEFVQVLISAALVGGLFALLAPGSGIIIVAFNSLVPANSAQVLVPAIDSTTPGGNFTNSTASSSQMSVDMDCGATSIDSGTVLCFAYNYLSLLELQILGLMGIIFLVNLILDILSKIAIDVIVVEVVPLSGLSSIVQVLNSMLQSLFFLGVMVGVEKALLIFVDEAAMKIFLPIGVVLRCFFATRRLGGALIAIAIGLYLVFPLTIAMNALSVGEIATDAIQPLLDLQSAANDMNIMNHFSSAGDIISVDSWKSYIGSFSNAGAAFANAMANLPKMMTTFVALLVVQIVFLPVLSIMLTIIAIKELAGLFGSEVNLGRFEV